VDPVLSCLLLLTTVQAWLMFVTLDMEIDSPDFASSRENVLKWGMHGVWSIHNDEKQAFHDAKYLVGGQRLHVSLADYHPYAVSASFGLIGTWLTAAGFRLLGLCNAGARLMYVILTFMTNLLYALLCFKLLPGPWGLLAYWMYLVNFHTFFVARHAILENAFQLVLVATVCLYAYQPIFFSRNLDWICLASAACLSIKWSFVIYQYALLAILWAVEWNTSPELWRMAVFTGAGVLGCEGINAVIHHRAGILAGRYINVVNVFKAHTARTNTAVIALPAPTWKSAPRYFQLAARWFFAPLGLTPDGSMTAGLGLAGLVLVGTPVAAWLHGQAGRPILALFWFHLFCIALCCVLFFYPKRAVNCLSFTWLLAVYACSHLWPDGTDSFWFWGPAGIIAAYYAWRNFTYARQVGRCDGQGLAEAAARIEACLPEGERLYCDPYSYRALWRTTRVWKRTWDEQIKTQAEILAWALACGAGYVALMEDHDPIPAEMRLLITPLASFDTASAETDARQRFVVYRTHPAYVRLGGPENGGRHR
jgi:hypothetical protein